MFVIIMNSCDRTYLYRWENSGFVDGEGTPHWRSHNQHTAEWDHSSEWKYGFRPISAPPTRMIKEAHVLPLGCKTSALLSGKWESFKNSPLPRPSREEPKHESLWKLWKQSRRVSHSQTGLSVTIQQAQLRETHSLPVGCHPVLRNIYWAPQ